MSSAGEYAVELALGAAGAEAAQRRSAVIGRRQRLEWDLAPGAVRDLEVAVTIDADPGFLHLLAFSVAGEGRQGNRQALWQTERAEELAACATLEHMVFCDSPAGQVFAIEQRPARLVLRPPIAETAVEGVERVHIEIELDWSRSADFLVVQDSLMRERAALAQTVEEQRARLETLEEAASELALIKRSKVWRLAEAFRKAIYLGLLGRFPALQAAVLSLTRDGPRKSLAGLRRLGIGGVLAAFRRPAVAASERDRDYERFREMHRLTDSDRERIHAEIAQFELKPKISVVMPVYNAPVEWLKKAVESVTCQLYENWELCIVDDKSTDKQTLLCLWQFNHPRIKVRFGTKNKNIAGATNDAIEFASGEYIALLDNDDELTEDALYEVVKAINEHDPELIYSDEDFISTDGNLINPHFKPDYSPDLLLSHNYVTHLLVIRRELLEKIGRLRPRCDGAQDYDLVLRATEATTRIHHIPKVLYHWRMSASSTSFDAEAKPKALQSARLALEDAVERRGIKGAVQTANMTHFFRLKRQIEDEPLVSIIIPFKDKPELLDMCIGAILERSTYKNFEIVGISNYSELASTFDRMRALQERDPRVRFVEYNIPFNFSKLINFGAAQAKGEHLVIMNNDVEVMSWDWIQSMLEHSQRPEVGVVGGKLYYPDNIVQHAGIIVGIGNYAGHAHKRFPSYHTGYFNRLNLVHDVSAVTGAWMMVSKEIYDEVGGLDEERFAVACNDVDFCLRVRGLGYWNVFTPYAEAWHRESSSRGYEDTPEKIARFETEKAAFRERHADILAHGDPFYNVNLTLDAEGFELRLR